MAKVFDRAPKQNAKNLLHFKCKWILQLHAINDLSVNPIFGEYLGAVGAFYSADNQAVPKGKLVSRKYFTVADFIAIPFERFRFHRHFFA